MQKVIFPFIFIFLYYENRGLAQKQMCWCARWI